MRRMRITEDEEKELANPNSEKEWVKKHQANERKLIESGVTKEQLDSLVAYYKSKLDSDEPRTFFMDSLTILVSNLTALARLSI